MTTEQTQAPTQAPPQPLSIDEISGLIAKANEAKDYAEVVRLSKLMGKQTKAIQEQEALKIQQEQEALAGVREAVAKEIHKKVAKDMPEILGKLIEVKASGFTFKLDTVDGEGNKVKYQAVELAIPTVKKVKRAAGTRSTGTGISLGQLIEQYATKEEKAKITKAYDDARNDPANAGNAKAPGYKKFQAQDAVRRRILKDHPELIS